MSRIKKFSDYVNEDYSFRDVLKRGKKMVSDLGGWISSLMTNLIPEGPKSGAPMVAYMDATPEKSILQQVRELYGKTAEESEDSSLDLEESQIEEAMDSLAYPTQDVVNVDAKTLKGELKDRFDSLLEGGFAKPIFIFGAPGIGKTEIVAQVCDELGIQLMTVDLQFMDPADFLGVPKVVDVASDDPVGAGVTRANPPQWLPRDNGAGDKGGIIFFDELNRAADPVITGMMNLAQGRRVNTYNLPDKWLIVAAGNRPSDDAPEKVKELGTALADRFSIYNYVPSVKGWIDYVQKSDKPLKGAMGAVAGEVVLPELVSFLEFSEDYFHTLDPNKPDVKFATPRGWIDASKFLYSKLKKMEKSGSSEISADELLRIFQTEVGYSAANAFVKFYNIVQSIPIQDVVKVFDEPEAAPIPKKKGGAYEPDVMFATLAAIVSRSEKVNPDKTITPEQFSNAVDYAIRIDSAEYASSFVNMLISKHAYATKDPKYMKSLQKFHNHYIVPLK